MVICSVSTKRVYWAALMPYWGGCTVAGLVADTLRLWQPDSFRRVMNRLASAQVTSRRCVFFFSPR